MQLTSLSLALTRAGFLTFSPVSLFTAGEQGVWYDPSDMSTMFQDAVGTTPVTGMEQPVGRILDKSGRGNHATQTTATSRPVLSARVNLLTKTEQFDDAAWTRASGVGGNPTITQNTAIAPNGTMTADTYTQVSTANTSRIYQSVNLPSGVAHKHVMHVKKNVGRWAYLAGLDGALTNGFHAWFDLDTGQVGSSSAIGAGTFVSANITSVENGFYRIEVFGSVASTSVNACWFYVADANNSTTRLPGGSAFIWGADLRVANTGVGLPAYQRVNTATDYDTAGFPHYLRFDGVDDWLVTPNIDFTGTDKMTVFAGSRYFGDATAILCELSTNSSANSGSFLAAVNDFSSGRESNGGRASAANIAGAQFIAPNNTTRVTTRQTDFAQTTSAAEFSMRINGVVQTPATSTPVDAGSGNFGNYPLFIGRRGGTTIPFNGHLYSLIVRGAQSTAQQIASAEAWVNGKTGAY